MALRAIISDIHSNLEALEAVIRDIMDQGADDIVCLGDIVGYGPNPVECVDFVRRICTWSLLGNHEAMLLMREPQHINSTAHAAIRWQRSLMLPGFFCASPGIKRWKWLQDLQPSRTEGDALYVHGSPSDPLYEYVFPYDFADSNVRAKQKIVHMFECFKSVAFCGHSHIPGMAVCESHWLEPEPVPTYRWLTTAEVTDDFFKASPHRKILVNVGSVGQPRDRDPRAGYVLFDGKTIRFRRVEYEIEKTMAKIAANPILDSRFGERLRVGH